MTKPTLEQATELLRHCRLDDSLAMIAQVMEQEECLEHMDRLNMLREDYDRMLMFMCRGYADEQRSILYGRLQQRTWQLIQDVELSWRMRNKNLYIDAKRKQRDHQSSRELIRSVLEGYVADMTMIMLMPDDERNARRQQLEERHEKFMTALFAKLWTAPQWGSDDQQFYTQLVLLPTIDSRDAQLIISAISISVINLFDIRKFSFLVDVYLQANDEYVRQRALVGWAFAIPEHDEAFLPELKRNIQRLLSDETVRRELLELQIQVYWCLNAERDHAEIERDIIPVFLENNNFHITRYGIIEKEEDELEDILHPDEEEQRMEALEVSLNKMKTMYNAGSDVYFGGFSRMKRFPFFNEMSHWLMPFYLQHPELQNAVNSIGNNHLAENVLAHTSFCDSDKYSFILSLATFMHSMPSTMQEAMNIDTSEELFGMSADEKQSGVFICRMYLQDLYRFYMLFPRRDDLVNCFVHRKNEETGRKNLPSQFFFSTLLREPAMDEEKLKLAKFLAKRKHWNNLSRVLDSFYMERALRPAEYFVLEAQLALHNKQYAVANKSYQIVLQMDNDNMAAISGWARTSMLLHYYEDALKAYRMLLTKQPDNINFQLNESIALLKLQRTDEAMEILYKLNYEDESNDNVKRIMAWGFMCQNRLDQALEVYDKLLENDQRIYDKKEQASNKKPVNMHEEDYLNAGYCQWFSGNVEQALNLFVTFVKILNRQDERAVALQMLEDSFKDDTDFILSHGISATELCLMIDLVKKSL